MGGCWLGFVVEQTAGGGLKGCRELVEWRKELPNRVESRSRSWLRADSVPGRTFRRCLSAPHCVKPKAGRARRQSTTASTHIRVGLLGAARRRLSTKAVQPPRPNLARGASRHTSWQERAGRPRPTGIGQISPGESWAFQCWFRDTTSGGAGDLELFQRGDGLVRRIGAGAGEWGGFLGNCRGR